MLSESLRNLQAALNVAYPDLRRVTRDEREAVKTARASMAEAIRALELLEGPHDEHGYEPSRAKFGPGAFDLRGSAKVDEIVRLDVVARVRADGIFKPITGDLVAWENPVRLSRRKRSM